MKDKVILFWFRRDLCIDDNIGLFNALNNLYPVLPIFIFDSDILEKLESKNDRRVDYIRQALSKINHRLKAHNACLNTFFGKPLIIFKNLSDQYDVQAVYYNQDYEPNALKRDNEINDFFEGKNIPFKGYKNQVIFEKSEVLKNDGSPYTVFTPYSKKWKAKLTDKDYKAYNPSLKKLFKQEFKEVPSLNEIGFTKTDLFYESPQLDAFIIGEYDKYRDYPALQKTTQLGIALRFGTISIRECVSFAILHNQTWLNQLIWREFFMQIIYHFPHVEKQSFKNKYDAILWRNDEHEFYLWCVGKTGYPIVDAGMRQLNKTGYMHNRVRMICASFLCKHLLIDWRWGELYFAQKLNDYDLSANNGNWQWAAGSGCDAAPYFRIFNPTIQTQKFDKNLDYIKKWIPELNTQNYSKPIVEHSFARERALKTYSKALK